MEKKITQAFDAIRVGEDVKRRAKQALQSKDTEHPAMKRLAAAVAALLILLSTGIYGVYATPVSAISVDGEVSTSIEVNRFGRVVACGDPDVCHLPYGEAVKRLTQDDPAAEITVTLLDFIVAPTPETSALTTLFLRAITLA